MTILSTTLAVLLFLASIAAHEAGHAMAFHRAGFPIAEAGLGLPLWPRITLRPTRRRPFTLRLSPWLFGAYVQPREEDTDRIDALPYRDYALICGIGIIINGIIGTTLGAILSAANHRYTWTLIFAGIAVTLWIARRPITAYLLPVLTLGSLAFVADALLSPALTGEPNGPVGIALALTVDTPYAALGITAVINIALVVLNTLPVYPFDGGQIWRHILKRRTNTTTETTFMIVGGVLTFGLLLYSLATDIIWFTH